MEATLTLMKDGQALKEYPLGKRTVLGRSDDADIVIDDPNVSRCHASVTPDGNGYVLKDWLSSNGTLLNGRRVDKARLRDGDEIRVAGHVLRFKEHVEAVVRPSAEVAVAPEGTSVTNVLGTTLVTTAEELGLAGPGEDALKHRLNVFFEVASEVTGTFEVDQLLLRILDALFRVFAQADRGFIMLIDPETGELEPKAVKKKHEGDEDQITVSTTVINKTIHDRQALLCQDAMFDERFQASQSIVSHHIRSVMCAPLAAKNEIVGVVHIDTTDPERPFTQDDLNMLTGMAAQGAMAIRNTQLYEEKVKSERLAMVGQTIAGLAHCVKNVLNGIKGGAFMVDLGISKPDEGMMEKGWDIVKRNNEFMNALVLDMLAYAKEREPEYQVAQVNDVVRDVCELMTQRAKDGNIKLTQALAEDVRPIAIDSMGVQRSVLNLVTNAIDACVGEGAEVVVGTSLHEDDGEVHITIRDDGCGISEEGQKKLFQVFFSTKGSKGTGLGLAVTQKIIHEHKGEIDVDSEEGKGTTFTIRLPLREELPNAPEEAAPSDTHAMPAV